MTPKAPASVLVVDDTQENLRLLARTLSAAGYAVRTAAGGQAGLAMAREQTPDLVLLDIDMPDLDGFAVCERMQADPQLKSVPVLFISAMQDTLTKVKGLRAGGRDYLTKPFSMEELLARVATQVELRRLELELTAMNAQLTQRVADQVREISEAQLATIVALAKLSETRDDTTGMHVIRIAEMSRVLAHAVRALPDNSADISETFANAIGKAATLHDIGKVAIPDAILLKPGKLTFEEFEVMKTHAALGAKTLEAVLATYPGNVFIRVGADIARSHHEKWDGSGYPNKLVGETIPIAARIAAVADVYDALRSKRPYKDPLPHDSALAIMSRGNGTHFDPMIMRAFATCDDQLDHVWVSMQG